MDQQGNGNLTAASILATRRRRVETSIGGAITVRGLSFSEISELSGVLVDVSRLADEVKEQKPEALITTPGGRGLLSAIEKIVKAGCVEPVFGSDPAAGPIVADLPLSDQMAAFSAILDLSGHTKKAAEEIRP